MKEENQDGAKAMTREQKEMALVDALNKATDVSKGFFLHHLSMYCQGNKKIRDHLMAMDAAEFDVFYEDEISNLKAGPKGQQGGERP